jgi:hypothetical protein
MFDEITCEEFYGEDLWAEFLEGVRIEVNFELQEIADLQKQQQVEVELDSLVLG